MPMQFLPEIPINRRNTLRQLLGRFQTVDDGLPELLKNAKDQYSRQGITERQERVIVVAMSTAEQRLAVIDFAGANEDDFNAWVTWSDPDASRANAAVDIEGGHGNGGKAFMARGCLETAFLESVRDGYRTKVGYENDDEDKAFLPGYWIDDGTPVKNVKAKSARKHLDSVLSGLDLSFSLLPESARAIFEKRQAFTVCQLNAVRDWDGRRKAALKKLVAQVPVALVEHPQAAWTIESCSVFIVIDGFLMMGEKPLERGYPEPMSGFEDVRSIVVPQKLVDPRTDEEVVLGASSQSRVLQLRTSSQSLRHTSQKPLNVIRVRNARNVVDNWSIADLAPRAESAYVLGELRYPDLPPDCLVGADRSSGFADVPIARALKAWTATQIVELSGLIQKAIAKDHAPEEMDAANDGLRKMRDLMRTFLEDASRGHEPSKAPGAKSKDGNDSDHPPPPPPPPAIGKAVHEIVLEGGASSIAIAAGTSVPLHVRAFEIAETGERLLVRKPKLRMEGGDQIVDWDDRENSLVSRAAGTTEIRFADIDTGVLSNPLKVEVIKATGAEITNAPSRLLLQGEDVQLRIVFRTNDGPRDDLLADVRADVLVDADVDEPNMGRVDRYGVFTAGGKSGVATVRVRFGGAANETVTATLEIGTDRIRQPEPKPKNSSEGSDVPLILLCGTPVPGNEHFSVDQRTYPALEHEPTIIDFLPQFFPRVIFINHNSKESMKVRSGRGGPKGMASIDTAVFLQFLALKCFEILKRLYVRQELKERVVEEQEFRMLFAEAEQRCAAFIDRAFDLAHEITQTAEV